MATSTRSEVTARRGTALARRAVRLLLDRGLMSPADVHRYGMSARDVSESNGVVLVELGNGRGFAVKDTGAPRDGGQGDPAREVALYRAAGGVPGATRVLPRLELYDEDAELLVLEGVISARRLDRLAAPHDPLDPRLAAAFGRTLGVWHRVAAGLPPLRPAHPWLFDIDGPDRLPVLDNDEKLRSLTADILGDPAHLAAKAAVEAAWTPDTAVHGDVRFGNVLIRSSGEALLIDWESAGAGDSRWDVAAGLQEYLSAGGVLRPGGGSDTVAAFLDGYAAGRGRPVEWDRLAEFTACRLLVRALQLTTWLPAPDVEVERHRALAREVVAVGAAL
ncbi:Phosphotransferase enzyme family protein [Sinosporangium album]|uniref:Phosphotransferase enzyme family protein n=1 Tax=Sinosporangium album TaxID=504805 RepID=A0A1G8GBX4_9ACTN|nr:phosphotransferase [Sinosporangium album]SDH91820.1 Phosphotransferase enzyme family protein [Sinosporangium album]